MGKLLERQLCERALIRISQGDLSALTVIYEHFGKLLFAIAYSILRDRDSAEDILHDTFVRIAENAHMYKKGTHAVAWLVSVCRNLALSRLKRENREAEYYEASYISDNQGHSDLYFMDMLSSLTAEEREIVILKVYCGFKHIEIAEALGITVENTRKKYTRAIEKLKKQHKEGE